MPRVVEWKSISARIGDAGSARSGAGENPEETAQGADDSIAIDGSYLAPPCNESAQATTADFVGSLAAVTRWEVRDSNHVGLDGIWRIELTRLP